MIVAFMNPLSSVKKNGSTIPTTIRIPARILGPQTTRNRIPSGPSALSTCWRHSRSCALSSRMSAGLPRFLAQQAARPQDHDRDQVAEHHGLRPLSTLQTVVREGLDDTDDQAAQHGPVDVPDAAHPRG